MKNQIPAKNRNRLVFVYGTLKTGFCRNYYLADSLLVGKTRTSPDYRMYDCGEYPGMVAVAEGQGEAIWGEVWEVSNLDVEQLDVVEAVDQGLYRREPIQLEESFNAPVEGYLYNRSIKNFPDCGDNWTRGFQS